MRLLLINYEYPPLGGGAANATRFIARELAKAGHHVVVLTSAISGHVGVHSEEGVRVHRLRTMRRRRDRSNVLEMATFVAAALLTAPRICRIERIEASIAFFSVPSGPIALMLRRRLSIPYLVSLRGGDVPGLVPELDGMHRVLTPIRRSVLRHAISVIANAPELADRSVTKDHLPVEVVPNGVDVDFYSPGPRAVTKDKRFIFLFVGRLTPQKNLVFILEALNLLQSSTGMPFALEVVGDGPLRGELELRSRELGIDGMVHWRGWYDKVQLRDAYRAADCFLNPSLYEGMPNTVLEAMACGLPVVASDIGGNRDLVVPETGTLIVPGDLDDFVAALRSMVESDDRRRAMGQAARARVSCRFTWAQCAKRYMEFLGAQLEEERAV